MCRVGEPRKACVACTPRCLVAVWWCGGGGRQVVSPGDDMHRLSRVCVMLKSSDCRAQSIGPIEQVSTVIQLIIWANAWNRGVAAGGAVNLCRPCSLACLGLGSPFCQALAFDVLCTDDVQGGVSSMILDLCTRGMLVFPTSVGQGQVLAGGRAPLPRAPPRAGSCPVFQSGSLPTCIWVRG